MEIHNYPGFFVAIEGLDGSGSDKIARLLAGRFKKEGLKVLAVKEPTQTPVGMLIKKLLKKKEGSISPLLLEFLFASDRVLLMEEKVIPALKKSQVVVADRCLWSSIAYRSLDLPIHWLLEINSRFIIPNMTYFIDVSPSLCAAKIRQGQDKFQIFSEEERLSQIRDGYLWICNKYPFWFRLVDGERKPQEIADKIYSQLLYLSGLKKRGKIS